ncbi:MAG: hypothetical protein ACPG5T_03840 [Endozoicomonas sp.]
MENTATVSNQLLAGYNLEIGAGLGEFAGKVWRIGLMGYGASKSNVLNCLSALESALLNQGHSFKPGEGLRLPWARINKPYFLLAMPEMKGLNPNDLKPFPFQAFTRSETPAPLK